MEPLSTQNSPDGLTIKRVPIESLHLDPANVRANGEENMEAIVASLQRFGHPNTLKTLLDVAGVHLKAGSFEAAESVLLARHERLVKGRGVRNRDAYMGITKLVELYEAWGRPDQVQEWRSRLPVRKSTAPGDR